MGRRADTAFVPALRPSTLDRSPVRSRLSSSFDRAAGELDFRLTLDVGAGQQPWRDRVERAGGRYIALDLEWYPGAPPPHVCWDGSATPVRDESVSTALLTEVLEHVPDPGRVLREIQRVLEPDGLLYFTVPFLWPVHDAPHDEARYTPFGLRRLLDEAGFDIHRMWALGGWDASLAQMIGLWARRRPMTRIARTAVSAVTFPVVRTLLRRDVVPVLGGNEMITGLGGIAAPRSPVQ